MCQLEINSIIIEIPLALLMQTNVYSFLLGTSFKLVNSSPSKYYLYLETDKSSL